MKKAFYLLTVSLILSFVFTSCGQKSKEKLIIGKWEIDTVYYENMDEVMPKFAEYAAENFRMRKQILQDSIDAMNKRGLKNSVDSLYMQTYQAQLSSTEQAINYYSDYETFKADVIASASKAKGLTYEFKSDSTLIIPDAPQPGKWSIKGDKLEMQIQNYTLDADIVKLTSKKLVFKTSQEVDSNLVITTVFELHKVK